VSDAPLAADALQIARDLVARARGDRLGVGAAGQVRHGSIASATVNAGS
jgi:hypothetical protein